MSDTELLNELIQKLETSLQRAEETLDTYLTDIGDMKILDVSLLSRKEKEQKIKEYCVAKQHVLDCDCSPGGILFKLAQKYNIPNSNFPFKTTMWIGIDYVKVRYGYQADVELIYRTKSYYERVISQDIKQIENYKLRPDGDFTIFSRDELIQEIETNKNKLECEYRDFINGGCKNEIQKLLI